MRAMGRTPQGVRGLKYLANILSVTASTSHPARGAWIEMFMVSRHHGQQLVAPRKGCVD